MQHGIRDGRRDPLRLEEAHHDVQLPADDPEQEGIADRHRQLVAHRRRALRIAIEQEVGHGGRAV